MEALERILKLFVCLAPEASFNDDDNEDGEGNSPASVRINLSRPRHTSSRSTLHSGTLLNSDEHKQIHKKILSPSLTLSLSLSLSWKVNELT